MHPRSPRRPRLIGSLPQTTIYNKLRVRNTRLKQKVKSLEDARENIKSDLSAEAYLQNLDKNLNLVGATKIK
jgi:uncharacterized protein YlxW (UPF0749 family)